MKVKWMNWRKERKWLREISLEEELKKLNRKSLKLKREVKKGRKWKKKDKRLKKWLNKRDWRKKKRDKRTSIRGDKIIIVRNNNKLNSH